jgi:hypothetical protein
MLGFHFGFSAGHAHQHVDQLFPILARSLSKLNVLPQRSLKTPDDLRELVDKYGDIVIDGVECGCIRPQDEGMQKARYSGKKKDIPLNL